MKRVLALVVIASAFLPVLAAAQQVDLAFRLSGRVVRLPISEGQLVEKEDVIAGLDDTQYRLAVDDRRATYERARTDYERGRNLVADGNISRVVAGDDVGTIIATGQEG